MATTCEPGRSAPAATRAVGGADADAGRAFAAATAAVALAAALAGWAPVGCSVVAVFLFAGPHNWMEARYVLARLPARWGKLRPFFLLGAVGVAGLSATSAALPWLARRGDWGRDAWLAAMAVWNSGLVLWVVALAVLRSRQNPKRDWGGALPLAFLALAGAWLAPQLWGLALVYLHPAMAFWVLDRELARGRPGWRRPYHGALALVPVLLVWLWWRVAGAPPLPGDDLLTAQVARHSGAGLLAGVSTRFLVAAHAFLELLHYGAWLVAVPLVALRAPPWRFGAVPLARRSPRWRRGVGVALAVGLGGVLVLWGGFMADYPATRSVYFTVAVVHVLAEVPLLLRAL